MTINPITIYGQGDDHVLKAVWYYEVGAGTTGQVEIPTGGTLLLDEFASGVDALCVGMSGVGGFVNWQEVEEADTTTVAVSSFDSDGNFVLTGVPSGYPVAIVFVYAVAGAYYDYTKDFLEHEIPGVGGSVTFVDLTDTPAAYAGQGGKIPTVNVGETALEFIANVTDHGDLTSIGTNTHAEIDTHMSDGTLHFLEGAIDHTSILNIGFNTHPQIDTHISAANNYLLTDCSNDPLTGDLEISKATPELKLTDTGDSNNARLVRNDTGGIFQVYNTVLKPGQPGNAIALDGTGDCIEIDGLLSDIATNTEGSISVWWKPVDATPAATKQIFAIADTSANEFLVITNGPAGDIKVTARIAGSDMWRVDSDAAVFSDNTWALITIVQNGTEPVIYINSVAVAQTFVVSMDKTVWLNDYSGLDNVRIGCLNFNGSGAAQHVTGTIDEVAVWSHALSVNDVSDLWNGGTGTKIIKANNFPTDGGSMGLNLEGLWYFDESAMNQAPGGLDAEDTSDNLNHGTASVGMTDADFVPGKIVTSDADVEISIWKAEDGTNPLEAGKITIGNPDTTLTLKGGDVANTGIRFNLDSTEIANFDNEGTLIIDNGDGTIHQMILRAAAGANENIQEWQDSSETILAYVDEDGGAHFNDLIIGTGESPTNYIAFAADGSMSQVGTARIDWTKIAANGATPTGCTSASSTSDLQSHNDGNVFTCSEVAATPNYLIVDFIDVTAFNWLRALCYYDGGNTHALAVQLEITPFDGSAWDNLEAMSHSPATTHSNENHSFFVPDDSIYINGGVVRARFFHNGTTVNAHQWIFDEVSLQQ